MTAKKKTTTKRPNILMLSIDSLLATHMSCYGYSRLTTPHMDAFAQDGVLFENTFSPNVPTTPGYTCMLTGRDVFATQCVALRHKGLLTNDVVTLPEILKKEGYNTTCVGGGDNPAFRGFDTKIGFSGWGDGSEGAMRKAENLNAVTVPEIERLAKDSKPFLMLLRHMDPHTPYMPPKPFDRMFYHGNECDPKNRSMDPVKAFKPFWDYFESWLPKGISDKDFVIAQYDGAIAYMDACIQVLFKQLESLGILDETIVVINSDHGETLYDHDCWFDHHGIYDVTLKVPLIIRYPKKLQPNRRVAGFNQLMDLTPTLLDLAGIKSGVKFDGRSLLPMVKGRVASHASSFYLTECTWMRKHGWRTPEWKLIHALEPDFHFKPEVELYNLVEDPDENVNVARQHPDIVAVLEAQMQDHIARRERETGKANPIHNQPHWHGHADVAYFTSSQQAYDTLHIGSAKMAQKLQAGKKGK